MRRVYRLPICRHDRGSIPGGRMTEPVRRILLIKPSSLGDIVHAMPTLAALRERFPRPKSRGWSSGNGRRWCRSLSVSIGCVR